ncbi:hypothetical protein BGZ50_002733 [Haplosporangium sp. Z 11]|nr:hypothetical protein BGZ50_002733 [Haplosporangium sp. Z 11]
MMISRRVVMQILLDCIYFEFVAAVDEEDRYSTISFETLAGSFSYCAQMYRNYGSEFNLPSDRLIEKLELDTEEGITEFILDANVNFSIRLFPHFAEVHPGYYVRLPPFSAQNIQEFMWTYAKEVPDYVQDDIAALIQGLRDYQWGTRGSGGTWCWLDNELRGALKFSRQHNADKLARQNRQDESRLERERKERERLQREEEERLERERERLKREEEVRREQVRLQRIEQEKLKRQNRLDEYIYSLERSTMSTFEQDINISNLRDELEWILRDYFDDDGLDVDLFGSHYSGLSTQTSDADFTLMDDNGTVDSVREIADVLRDSGYQNVVAIAKARVPIVSFYDPNTGVHCDMNINQPLGVYNSKLIATYRKIDDRFRPLFFAIRHMAKKHGILGANKGFLSSYALTLMLITFLQSQVSPPILPRLQQQSLHKMVQATIQGIGCTFDRNWSNYRTFGQENGQSVGQLFMQFCQYFGLQYNYADSEVNPRLGGIRKRPVGLKRPEPFRVMDPFITTRNTAVSCWPANLGVIQACFRNAYHALERGDIDSVFVR